MNFRANRSSTDIQGEDYHALTSKSRHFIIKFPQNHALIAQIIVVPLEPASITHGYTISVCISCGGDSEPFLLDVILSVPLQLLLTVY